MDEEHKMRVALWRFSVLGSLVSARREHGDVKRLLRQAAAQLYERWDGRIVRVPLRTLEDWYYAYRKSGLDGLKPKDRSDIGLSRSISPELAELILKAKKEKPRRSIRRIIKLLERARKVGRGRLTTSTVHRLLQGHGLSARPAIVQERRSWRSARAGDLWMGDVMHGPGVLDDGRLRKAYLHVFLDSAVRFVPACAFRLGETAGDLEAVLKQAFLKHGLPRVLYLDWGAAQISDSLRIICAELGVRLLHCKPRDPAAKGGVERLIRTVREELVDELPEGPLDLVTLNRLLWAWLSTEYHRRLHDGTGRIPLEHWLSQAGELRPAPRAEQLDHVFLHRAYRRVRKDGTVRFGGQVLEVRPELSGRVELRFDPADPGKLPRVYIGSRFYCDTVRLDVVGNSNRRRHTTLGRVEPGKSVRSGLDPLELIRDEHERRSRPPSNDEPPRNTADNRNPSKKEEE